MQNKDQARGRILELCSEDAYGSWLFWSESDNKSEAELQSILEAIIELVKEKKIEVLEHKFNGPYTEVSFNSGRLRDELKHSIIHEVNPDIFYWFAATDEGKKEDQ